jgi:hypothetical protein
LPRVLPGVEVDEWLLDEPDGPRRQAVEKWLLSLVRGDSLLVLMSFPGADPSVAIQIPDTELIATCIMLTAFDAIVIERIGPE